MSLVFLASSSAQTCCSLSISPMVRHFSLFRCFFCVLFVCVLRVYFRGFCLIFARLLWAVDDEPPGRHCEPWFEESVNSAGGCEGAGCDNDKDCMMGYWESWCGISDLLLSTSFDSLPDCFSVLGDQILHRLIDQMLDRRMTNEWALEYERRSVFRLISTQMATPIQVFRLIFG